MATHAAPVPHTIGAPVRLSTDQIRRMRDALVTKYGSREQLLDLDKQLGLKWAQRVALEKLEDLDYLEGVGH